MKGENTMDAKLYLERKGNLCKQHNSYYNCKHCPLGGGMPHGCTFYERCEPNKILDRIEAEFNDYNTFTSCRASTIAYPYFTENYRPDICKSLENTKVYVGQTFKGGCMENHICLDEYVFVNCKFEAIETEHRLRLTDSVFIRCTFDRIPFDNLTIDNCTFKNCFFSRINLSEDCHIYRSTFVDSKIIFVTFRHNTSLRGCIFNEIKFDNVVISPECDTLDNQFNDCDIRSNTNYGFDRLVRMNCPETGAFVAWKWIKDTETNQDVIIKLVIPEDAQRSSGSSKKCRASKAYVDDIQYLDGSHFCEDSVISPRNFIYALNEIVYPDSFDYRRFHDCSRGIHFFMNREDAVEYSKMWL